MNFTVLRGMFRHLCMTGDLGVIVDDRKPSYLFEHVPINTFPFFPVPLKLKIRPEDAIPRLRNHSQISNILTV
jgi:hypothetical protein